MEQYLPRNVSYRQYDHWISKGWLKVPDKNPGTGNRRPELSFEEQKVLEVGAKLIQFGFGPEAAFQKARILIQHKSIEMNNIKLTLMY